MISKVIHYCWFGGGEKSELIKKCIESWKEYCPDYEIIEWNETNFDVNSIPYTRDAYADKKWAFVSDYARLRIVYENGGIYLDTDVLLRSNRINELLDYDCWIASDDVRYINTGLGFGAKKGHFLIKTLLDEYKNYTYPTGVNTQRDTKVIEKTLTNWHKSDQEQVVDNIMIVGLRDYGKYAKHLYAYTWAEDETQVKQDVDLDVVGRSNSFGVCLMWKLKCAIRNPKLVAYFDKRKGTILEKIYTFLAYDFLDAGLVYWIKKIWKKIFKKN